MVVGVGMLGMDMGVGMILGMDTGVDMILGMGMGVSMILGTVWYGCECGYDFGYEYGVGGSRWGA